MRYLAKLADEVGGKGNIGSHEGIDRSIDRRKSPTLLRPEIGF